MRGHPRDPAPGPPEPGQGSCPGSPGVSRGGLAQLQLLLVALQSEAPPGVHSGASQASGLLKHPKMSGKIEYLLTADGCSQTHAACSFLYPADQLGWEEALQES